MGSKLGSRSNGGDRDEEAEEERDWSGLAGSGQPDPFNYRVKRVDPIMTQTQLAQTQTP